jgi:hypothetical protein
VRTLLRLWRPLHVHVAKVHALIALGAALATPALGAAQRGRSALLLLLLLLLSRLLVVRGGRRRVCHRGVEAAPQLLLLRVAAHASVRRHMDAHGAWYWRGIREQGLRCGREMWWWWCVVRGVCGAGALLHGAKQCKSVHKTERFHGQFEWTLRPHTAMQSARVVKLRQLQRMALPVRGAN